MNNSGNFTHKPRAVSPEAFRAQATGIGQSRGNSLMTGTARAYEVAEHMPPHCRRAVPAAEGFGAAIAAAPMEGQAEDDGLESRY
jgi:hypothetical protein